MVALPFWEVGGESSGGGGQEQENSILPGMDSPVSPPVADHDFGSNNDTSGKYPRIKVKISHYEPWRGGVNCAYFAEGQCLSKMASGERWQEWIGRAIACPRELPFGTTLRIDGRDWVCMDRGGKIVKTANGAHWVDMLIDGALYPYGYEMDAEVIE